MISIPGSLSFAKLVMMSSAPAKSAGDARDPLIDCPIQSRLQTNLIGMRSCYVERNYLFYFLSSLTFTQFVLA